MELQETHFNDYIEEINLGQCSITSKGLKCLRWEQIKYIGFEGAVITGIIIHKEILLTILSTDISFTDLEFIKRHGNLKFIQWTIST